MPVCTPCQRGQHERCDGCLVCQHRPTPKDPSAPAEVSTTPAQPITESRTAS